MPTLLFAMLVVLISGCQRYGEVSEAAYTQAGALYSICNLKDSNRLRAFGERLEQDESVSAKEREWLLEIVRLGENEEWETASNRIRQMLDEQVE